MKTLTLVSVLALISSQLFAAPAPQKKTLRLIETSKSFVSAMVERYPTRVKAVSNTVMLVPSDLMVTLGQQSHDLTGRCGGFMDITSETSHRMSIKSDEPLPELGSRKEWITTMLEEVRGVNVRDFDLTYTGQFKTRLASSPEGEAAPRWLAQTWGKMAADAGRDDIKVEVVPGPEGYNQGSVRITIPGKNPELPIVVMGAHLDSINHQGEEEAPGQDDDASGIAALTEAYHVILTHNAHPNRTIQIFGYAAEELGLLGSRVIAEHYQSSCARVRAVLQLDMVAYPSEAHAITFITDNVDKDLTLWTEQLYGLYVGGQVLEDRCGYGCSDHASWHRYGYPSVMPFESPMRQMNHRLHTAQDLWDQFLDADYAARFTKLAIAFAAELSQ